MESSIEMNKSTTQTVFMVVLCGFFSLAVGAFVWALTSGAQTINLLQLPGDSRGVSLAFRLDSLSTIILLMVTFLGVLISQYSVRYLDGESRQDRFFVDLGFTVAAVAVFVTAANLVMLFIAWLAISLGLHRLLLFYPDRKSAVRAARKKFLVSRIGDFFLLLGIFLVYRAFGTFDFQEIFKLSQGVLTPIQEGFLSWSGFFFVCGAMTKSAQFPFHFWLPETMETPTPVSALMHAGIINAGGFLILRLSPLIAHASFASLTLAVLGAVTGVFASLVMITQNDIKRKLAYSTISQMGLMMFACGIGAYSIALFHIVAHSLYKANAFLSTGELVEESKKISFKIAPQILSKMLLFTGSGLAFIVFGLLWRNGHYLSQITYFSVLFLGLSQNSEKLEAQVNVKGLVTALVTKRVITTLALGIVFYALIETALHLWLSNEVLFRPDDVRFSSPLFIICLISYLIFTCGYLLSNGLIKPKSRFDKWLYVFLWNGAYFGVLSDRLLRTMYREKP